MKKAIFVIMYSCLSCALNAQFTVEWAFSKASYSTVPFNFYKDCSFEQTYTIENPGYIMPDRLYQNFQLTEYYLARENPETAGALRLKFKLKNGYDLGLVDFGGVTEWMTYDLITVNKNSEILDALEVGIKAGVAKPKQFRITADEKIIVMQLVTTETTSVQIAGFSKVTGYITETVYHIDASGKFVKESETRRTGVRTFTEEQLNCRSTDLWDLY